MMNYSNPPEIVTVLVVYCFLWLPRGVLPRERLFEKFLDMHAATMPGKKKKTVIRNFSRELFWSRFSFFQITAISHFEALSNFVSLNLL